MQLFNDEYDKIPANITSEYNRRTTFAQTQMEYDGHYPQDDDAADHIRFPRVFNAYGL